jgi:hypothetical protein
MKNKLIINDKIIELSEEDVNNLKIASEFDDKEDSQDVWDKIRSAFQPKGVWKPAFGGSYYSIVAGNRDFIYENEYCNDVFDTQYLSIGNCFQTEKEAQKALKWLKALQSFKEYLVQEEIEKETTPGLKQILYWMGYSQDVVDNLLSYQSDNLKIIFNIK